MTGPYEHQLAQIVAADQWNIPNIAALGDALSQVADDLATLAEYPGGQGNWATSASNAFSTLQGRYSRAATELRRSADVITAANRAKATAAGALDGLPGLHIPAEIKAAIDLGLPFVIPFLGPALLPAAAAIGLVEQFLGGQREEQAKAALDELQGALQDPRPNLTHPLTPDLGREGFEPGTEIHPVPSDTTAREGGSGGSHYSPSRSGYSAAAGDTGVGNVEEGTGLNGSFGGSAAGSGIGVPSGGGSGAAGYGSTSADGDLSGGTVPGTGFNGGIGLAGSGGGRGGEGLRGLGIGAGSAASAAAVAAAARMGGLGNLGSGSLGGGGLGGGGLGGGTGGGLRVGGLGAAAGKGGSGGTGGLLGSGAKATVAASSAEEGAGGAAGSKSSNSMMGGQGGQGGTNKEKRSGLGGFIAPKLEDDEELGPRSAGASAGGRDAARE